MKPMRTSITKPGICGILAMAVLISCHDKEIGNREYMKVQIPVIEKTIKDAIGWAKNKDFDIIVQYYCQ